MIYNSNKIYMDYAATTPIDPEVLESMLPYLKNKYGNPSSIHSLGQEAKTAMDDARDITAEFLNCSSKEIIFTGSATEANNLAIKGVMKKLKSESSRKPHVITSEIEHHAVLKPCEELEKQGVEVTYVSVNEEGIVEKEEIEKAIEDNTRLISIMYANNEIGTIQPIKEIGELIQRTNKGRSEDSKIFFHTDAVQAVNYLEHDVKELKVDLLTLSAHKIYGPKGVGALYFSQDVPIEPVIHGGGHEKGLRSGTENVAGIVGLGEAIRMIKRKERNLPALPPGRRGGRQEENEKIKNLRDKLIEGILRKVPNTKLNGSQEKRLPNNVNVSITGVEGESLVISLDQEDIEASTGSACSTDSLEPSHVLLALGLSPKEAHGSLRLTLGKYSTEKEINKVIKELPKIVKRLRDISPF